MTSKLKIGTKIKTNDKKYRENFEKLKVLIMSESVLKYPDFNKKLTVTTDTSNCVVCCASRT